MADIRVYGYLRVSGAVQVNKGGFNRQEKAIKGFCKQHRYTIDSVFKEKGVSGTKDELNRPAFQEMVGTILCNGVDTVVIESLDRLARELNTQEQIITYLIGKNINLISAATGENVTEAVKTNLDNNPTRKMLIQIQGAIAEADKAQLVIRLRKGREKVKAEKGKCAGSKHFGENSEEEKGIIKRIAYLRRLGRGQYKRMSFQKIADKLNEEGIRTKRNNTWTSTGIKNVVERKSRLVKC
jgi:DNA invertase Pin-like site-specific DNA recombinase